MRSEFKHKRSTCVLLAMLLALSCSITPLQAEAASPAEQEETLPAEQAETLPAEQEKALQETSSGKRDYENSSGEELSTEHLELPELPEELSREPETVTETAGENSSPQAEGENIPADGLVQQGNYYVLYVGGQQVTAAGWQELPTGKFLIDADSHVAARMEAAGSSWLFFQYSSDTLSWELRGNIWETVNGKDYYFDTTGICTKIFDTVSAQLTVFANDRMIPANNYIYPLKDGRIYYFDAAGICNTLSEWKKISSAEWYYVNGDGYVSDKLTSNKNLRKYYVYNYSTSQWEKQKDVWKTIEGKEYYFNARGKCVRIYNPATEKCQKYENGKLIKIRKDIVRLKNGKYYYFNGKGIRVTKKGWQKPSGKQYMEIGKKGYVTGKITKSGNTWKCYRYDYKDSKWKKQKKVWKTADKKVFYFNGSGKCTLLYNKKTGKCYDYKSGNMVVVRNDVRDIQGTRYYFASNGIRNSSPGLYLTASGRIIYAEANGTVSRELSGEILEYTEAGGKITSCRIRDSHFMCYYNSSGTLTRQIDLNQPMVALTYDDGPSQYTSEILDILEQYGGTATFFVVGNRVPSWPGMLKRAFDMGCEIGNHTYDHKILTKTDVATIQSQINGTNAAVQSITGVSPAVMRPPGGGYNGTVSAAVGMPIILWSIDTLDWKTRNPLLTQASVLNHVQNGDIILMHDLYSQTAAASGVIIPELRNRGYQLVTVSELSDCRGAMSNGSVYHAFP